MTEPMTDEQANAVYDVLVKLAGATEYAREEFVFHQTRRHHMEYRFVGSLGFGGKFYRDGAGDDWRVGCYTEDRTEARDAAINATNEALAALKRGASA